MSGLFITFEGSEGSGKSTQMDMLGDHLKGHKQTVLFLREPGGVTVSEQIRDILLDVRNKDMGPECETLLYMAARSQLVREKIAPALAAGQVVICDRFLDSTVVYQGYGCGVDLDWIADVGTVATRGITPHVTFLFDIDAQEGLARIQDRPKDRIELRAVDYHNRVREGYLAIARQNPERVKVIPVNQSREAIHRIVCGYVDPILRTV